MEPYWESPITTLYHADARQVPLADKSVHCAVTSPPYFGLRVYQDNDARGIGLEASVDAYLDSMMEVMEEVRRVLRDDGILWVNLGDSYGGSGKGQNGDGTHNHKAGDMQHTNVGSTLGGLDTRGEMSGQLLGIPWRFALRMQEAGWILRQDIIWDKAAPMPESLAGTRWEKCRVKVGTKRASGDKFRNSGRYINQDEHADNSHHEGDAYAMTEWEGCPGCPKCEANDGLVLRRGSWRCTSAHEHILMFVKSMGYFSDGEAVKLPAVDFAIRKGGFRHGGGGYVNHHADTTGDAAEPSNGALTGERGTTANRRSVWHDIKPEPYGGSHFATFPSSLPRICIQASTSEAGCCPHCGAQWARVIESKSLNRYDLPLGHPEYRPARYDNGKAGSSESPGAGQRFHETNTLSWRPTCQCPEHKPIPATVFDPFGGAGTSCLAAQRLGRRSVMTDLSESYLQQAIQRLSGATLPLGL